jgi:hypothetical protein
MMSFQGLVQLVSPGGFQHLFPQECEDRAKGGCPLCRLFYDILKNCNTEDVTQPLILNISPGVEDHPSLLSGKPSDVVEALAQRPSETSYLTALLQVESDGDTVAYTPLFTTECRLFSPRDVELPSGHIHGADDELPLAAIMTADPAARFISSRPMLGYADESKVFTTAMAWIEDCLHNHAETCPPNTNVPLPSRLIDVGDDMVAPDVRLRVFGQGETDAYTALSYCWGGPQPVTTTLSNIDSMRQRIVLGDLPRTIQDAICVTRSIGQRYLWVDALCIIQDSDEDKQHEIQKMGSIYKNAMLTISAATASAVSEGFLGRQPEPLPSLKWELDVPDVGTHTIFISTALEAHLPHHPLDDRGWALQESLLSPRLLVFSEQEPIWHCHAVKARAPKGSYTECAVFSTRIPRWLAPNARPETPVRPTPDQKLWADIVCNFTQRLLTDKEDRLNAVAGVAAELQLRWNDDYFFGHWKRFFVEQLAWYTAPPSPVSSGERSSRAPTWSWASLDTTIFHHDVDQVQATAQITRTRNGFPHVRLTCRTKRLETVVGERVRYYWDLAALASRSITDAVLILLGTHEPWMNSNVFDAACIIGIPTGKLAGGFQRIGLCSVRSLKERWQPLWEAVEPVQILLE